MSHGAGLRLMLAEAKKRYPCGVWVFGDIFFCSVFSRSGNCEHRVWQMDFVTWHCGARGRLGVCPPKNNNGGFFFGHGVLL